ncbi:MAG: SIMPL domain-containing protein [Planctomycetota bacterium]|nr:SIMPL domain-containing protein [Planctomycetota bacterium]
MTGRWLIPILATLQVSLAAAQPSPLVPQLTITGNSEISVSADELQMRVGATATNESLDAARSDVDNKMQAIVQALGKLGLKSRRDFHTSRYDVDPQWSQRPRGRTDLQDWIPQLLGYKVQSSVQINTSKLQLAGQIIESAVAAGANDIGGARFTLASPRTSRDEAIKQAAQFAIDDARTLAEATETKLVRIIEMSINNTGYNPPPAPRSMAMARTTASGSTPVMTPGQVQVTASVTIVYEIESEGVPAPAAPQKWPAMDAQEQE